MINQDKIDELTSGDRPGVVGALTVGGFPGSYSLRLGLTGPEIAAGEASEILRALGEILLTPWVAEVRKA